MEILKKIDKKVLHIGIIGLKVFLIVGLISAMILSFYCSTGIVFQYDIGIFFLRIGIMFSCFCIGCIFAFDRILKDI